MQVIRASERLRDNARPPAGRFHGRAMQQLLHESDDQTRTSFVRFAGGAHTHWHTHSGGLVLHIVEGRARVQAWDEDQMHELVAGDTAISPPGEKHRHGAAADTAMTQLAVTSGEVTWLEDAEEI
jgi:quercetin dioxygenase-like cupin family protein